MAEGDREDREPESGSEALFQAGIPFQRTTKGDYEFKKFSVRCWTRGCKKSVFDDQEPIWVGYGNKENTARSIALRALQNHVRTSKAQSHLDHPENPSIEECEEQAEQLDLIKEATECYNSAETLEWCRQKKGPGPKRGQASSSSALQASRPRRRSRSRSDRRRPRSPDRNTTLGVTASMAMAAPGTRAEASTQMMLASDADFAKKTQMLKNALLSEYESMEQS